eukprot:NODE_2824_length_736_cov_32.158661_g1989_i0.p6 GENE.NODE_2824_length_736_cov_32.158661_g1989_i0~~NODE_2824_length_736_cov_32.158661_g1989_i0.p6  ORF type:complete len:60 (+),score=8.51 NODE_2824_length_736_cov_32.158661_g1989_i0:355-534(+)
MGKAWEKTANRQPRHRGGVRGQREIIQEEAGSNSPSLPCVCGGGGGGGCPGTQTVPGRD